MAHPGGTDLRCPFPHFDTGDTQQTALTMRADHQRLHEAPVTWSDSYGGFWILSRYDDVRDAALDHARFSSAQGVLHIQPDPDGLPRSVALEQDPPEHTPFRRLYADWLNPRGLRAAQPMIDELTSRHVEAFAAAGGGDFVTEVSARLPVEIMARTLGLDQPELVHDLTHRLSTGNDHEASGLLVQHLMSEIARARTDPGDGYLATAVGASIEGRPIDDAELLIWMVGAAAAGHETTLLAGAALIYELARDPDIQDRVREDPELVPGVVEEALRLHSPVQRFFRTLTEDVIMHGTTMHAGDKVLLMFAAADQDPDRFPDPLTFDPARESNRHLAFGWGIHRCVGAALAQRELASLALAMLRHRFELAGDVTFSRPRARGAFLGIDVLPIRFT